MKLFKKKSVFEKKVESFWKLFLEFPFLWAIRPEWDFYRTRITVRTAQILITPNSMPIAREVYVVDGRSNDGVFSRRVTKVDATSKTPFSEALRARSHCSILYLVIVNEGEAILDHRKTPDIDLITAEDYFKGIGVTIYKPSKSIGPYLNSILFS